MLRNQILTRSPVLNVMIEAAHKAGRSLVKDFGEIEKLQVSQKGPRDFVSNADTRAEKIIYDILLKSRPDYGFLMEEGGTVEGADKDNRWIVDPLDGTTSFLHGVPGFSISIAHEKNGEINAGVIYDPLLDELYWAEKGTGAFMNSSRLRVAKRTQLENSLVVTDRASTAEGYEAFFNQLKRLYQKNVTVRIHGSAALNLAYVAAGRMDAYFEESLKPWDVAAGIIIVKEAGGMATEMNGGPNAHLGHSILASNLDIHHKFLEVL